MTITTFFIQLQLIIRALFFIIKTVRANILWIVINCLISIWYYFPSMTFEWQAMKFVVPQKKNQKYFFCIKPSPMHPRSKKQHFYWSLTVRFEETADVLWLYSTTIPASGTVHLTLASIFLPAYRANRRHKLATSSCVIGATLQVPLAIGFIKSHYSQLRNIACNGRITAGWSNLIPLNAQL